MRQHECPQKRSQLLELVAFAEYIYTKQVIDQGVTMADNRFMNTSAAEATQVDLGLRSYMLGVYNHMTTALLMTGFFAMALNWVVLNVAGVGQLVYGT
ncbi:MAG: hypothetical protein QGF33_13245, partial [Alphaproteobacteria bacterium]|nr:hypothetical protein [Alphaproteobacteria bacterium]